MNINVDLTEEQVKFLKQFAANQKPGSKDNLWTYKPLHIVQDLCPIILLGTYTDRCYCKKYYCRDNGMFYDTPEELVSDVKKLNDVVKFEPGIQIYDTSVENLEDYFFAYSVHADVAGFIENYEDKAFAFTLKEAKRYIEYQGHNLKNPRTYTASPGYSNNGDYEPFWDLLMTIGTGLLSVEQQQPDAKAEVV